MHVSTPNIYVNARFTKFILNDNDLRRVSSFDVCLHSIFVYFFSRFVCVCIHLILYDIGLLMQKKNTVIGE